MQKILISLIIILTCLVIDAFSSQDGGNLLFYLDTVGFLTPSENKMYVETFYQIPYSELMFSKVEGKYTASFEISASLYDSTNNEVNSGLWNSDITAPNFQVTNFEEAYITNRISFNLETNNRYKLKLKIRDKNSNKYGIVEQYLFQESFKGKKLLLSDLQFIEPADVSQVPKDYIKNNIAIFPNPRHLCGREGPFIYFYYEIYNLDRDTSEVKILNIKYTIKNREDDKIFSPTPKLPEIKLQSRTIALSETINVSSLDAGEYILTVEISEKNSSTIIKKSNNFELLKTDVEWGTDYDKTYSQIVYIATSEELKKFKKIKSPEERVKFIREFWKKRDPVPITAINEYLIEHIRRYKYVNENFSDYQPGWRTDKGRIYIKFGPPDEIERHPFETDSKPYEIWYYYYTRHKFIFVDETGFGKYRLANPEEEQRVN